MQGMQNQHDLSGLLVENDASTVEEVHSLQVQALARCGQHITNLNAFLTGVGPEVHPVQPIPIFTTNVYPSAFLRSFFHLCFFFVTFL